ncbi:hypothetical protein [Tahibacter soli]|uniref:Sel1 repeat-containing protein n=1 Tax=Tahibacter soli TaxID=2983605 RepID=A0A9X3YPD4_9GAMM|nr:hypothetical protein [Tahibacter soli]MDC8015010.1 hypothetical protein [Tahibacter soli]
MHFKGAGVSADRARGVAWLALAAERGDPPLADALEWGYAQLTPEEVARANAIWRDELKPRYGDAVAMPRAMSLWRMDLVMTTGSHLGYTIRSARSDRLLDRRDDRRHDAPAPSARAGRAVRESGLSARRGRRPRVARIEAAQVAIPGDPQGSTAADTGGCVPRA